MKTLHKYYIEKIISSRDATKIKKLGELITDTISYMKTLDADEYENIECDLYEISEGKVLNEMKATTIIENMKPYGMHWTLEQTEQVRKSNGYTNIKPIDFWIVMNSGYNDFHSLFNEDVEMYAKYSKCFIEDEDASEYKVYEYFTEIPKNKKS